MAEKILAFRVDVIGVSKEAQEIAKLDQQLKNLNQRQREINKARKNGNITREKSEKLLSQLASRTKDLTVKKQQLNKIERQNAKAFQASAGSVNKLQLQMAKLRDRMNQVNLTTKEGQRAWARMNTQYQQGQKTLQKYNGRLAGSARLQGTFTKGLTSSIKTMAGAYLGITALIKGLQEIVRVTGDFDSAQAKLAAITGKSREEIAGLTDEAKKLGATTVFTASQVTDLQIELAKLGFTANEIQNSTAAILDFAAATDAELGAAAKTAGVAVRAFGLDTLETADAVSTLAVATTKSALSFEDYETILSTVGPVARSYGFTLEDTIALTGKLRDAGFDASKAATATRNILLSLADANGSLAKSLGGSVGTFDELIAGLIDLDRKGISLAETLELTDKRSVAAFNQFLIAADSTRKLRDEITDVNDELSDMVKMRLDSFAGDVKALGSAWEGFILKLKTSGVIREVVQFMKDAILQVSNLDLAFRNFNKQSEEQIQRSFELLSSLSNKQGKEFRATVESLDDISIEELILDPEAYAARFAQIRHVNKREAVSLFDEYIRQRQVAAEKEIVAEQAKAERIKNDALEQEKKRIAETKKMRSEAANQELQDARARMDKLLSEVSRIDESGVQTFKEDYSAALSVLEYEFQQWGDEQARISKRLEDEYLARLERENEAYRKQQEEQLQIQAEAAFAKQQIQEQSIMLVNSLLDYASALQTQRKNRELAQAGDNAKKREAIERIYAKKEQGIAIVKAIINTAQGVTKALTLLPPFSYIMAGITAAAGAVEVATIAAQKFASGGKVKAGSELPGSTPGTDNTLALVQPGEVVLNKRQQAVMGGPSAFRKAGVPGFATGGVIGSSPSPNTKSIDNQIATQLMLGDLKVVLNLNELNEAQSQLAVINEDSGL